MSRAAPRAIAGLLLAASLVAGSGLAWGRAEGGVTARLVTPEGEFTVGDQLVLKLTATHPPGAVFDYPDAARLAGDAGGSESSGGQAGPSFLVEEVRPVEVKPPVPTETSWLVRIRPFTPGDIKLPAMNLTYRLPGASEPGTVATEPVSIRIKSVLKSDKEEPADIRGPWRIPPEWWRLAIYLVSALALFGALAWLARRLLKRRAPAAAQEPPRPSAPVEVPYLRAMRELEKLLASGLLAQGRLKEFHVILAEIVKRLLGAQHGFDALDRTTLEVLADLGRVRVEPPVREQARRFLEACDLVKFAKQQPPGSEIDETVSQARLLIETCRPAPAGREVAAA